MSIEKMSDVNNINEVKEVPGNDNKETEKGKSLRQKIIYGVLALSLAWNIALYIRSSRLENQVADAEAEKNEWFKENEQFRKDVGYALSEIAKEIAIDPDSLAKMKDWNIKKYQEHGNNIEKTLLGNIQDFMKVFRDSFGIKEEQWENWFWETFDIKITPHQEYFFEYNGFTYRYDIDPEKYEICFKIRDESLQDCGYVRVNLWKIGDDSTSTVGATEVVVSWLSLGDGDVAFKFDGNWKVIERRWNFFDGEHVKGRFQNEDYFAIRDERTNRMRFFDRTGHPLEWPHTVIFDLAEYTATFKNWFSDWPMEIRSFDGVMKGPSFHWKPVWEWLYWHEVEDDQWGASMSWNSMILPQ